MIDLRRFCMSSACFCTDSSSTFAQICWILHLSAIIVFGFASLQFLLHVAPHLFNRIQIWRVGGPLSARVGFDVIWDVLFEPFIRRPCFVWRRTIMYKCPTTIARAKYHAEIRFCFLQKG